ncbi:MAG TPA: DUF4350 domain-containing protein, partial [Gemmataceae bacterium]|nr:DUF4350 domain-containing protein [Gemmataceae bacterium]
KPRLPPTHSTQDAGPGGVRAAYLLLDTLGYSVATSRHVVGGQVRWLLFPNTTMSLPKENAPAGQTSTEKQTIVRPDDVSALQAWISDGGVLVLADEKTQFAQALGVRVKVDEKAKAVEIRDGSQTLKIVGGTTRVRPVDQPDAVWPTTGEPLVDIFRQGEGQIWILRRPSFLRNEYLREADNAVALCALADAMGGDGQRIYFDEYFHGLRDRPGVVELLLQPPTLWVTLEGVLVLALLLWHSMRTFGPVRASPPPRRRSKEEFLDAMAYLLIRKKAYKEAYQTAQAALRRDLEDALGLRPETAPAAVAERAALVRPALDSRRLAHALDTNSIPAAPAEFLRAVRELDDLRKEFFYD